MPPANIDTRTHNSFLLCARSEHPSHRSIQRKSMSYERFWGDQKLADVSVLVCEDGPAEGNEQKTVIAHKLVLAANSDVLRAQLMGWGVSSSTHLDTMPVAQNASDHQHSSSLPQIVLEVPEGQLRLGCQLVKAMYLEHIDLSDYSAEQLMHYLVLADRYAVHEVVDAIGQHLSNMSCMALPWETVLAIYALPHSLAEVPAFGCLYEMAAEALQQQLGDLEGVWADKSKPEQLLALPFHAVKQLLADPRTQVASENTAAYTVICWVQQNKAADADVRQLTGLVRMAHCTLPYLVTVIGDASSCFSQCLRPLELQTALLCPGMGTQLLKDGNKVLEKNRSWCAAPRPESEHAPIVWRPSRNEIKQLITDHLKDRSTATALLSQSYTRRGREFNCQLQVSTPTSPDDSHSTGEKAQHLHLGCYVHFSGQRPAAIGLLKAGFVITANDTARAADGVRPWSGSTAGGTAQGPFIRSFTGSQSWGFCNLVELEHISCWSQVESQLFHKHLMHDDGCLQIELVVWHLL